MLLLLLLTFVYTIILRREKWKYLFLGFWLPQWRWQCHFHFQTNFLTTTTNFHVQTWKSVIKSELLSLFLTDATAPAAFLRLMFHDCQVQGCDASILLDSNSNYGTDHSSEMISSRNFGIRKRETISHIKSILEEECPGQVSCADIIVLAAKESVSFSGGPHIEIPFGRKDSTTCSFREADAKLPSPTTTVDEFISNLMSKGMSVEESVSILDAHTLGVGHCLNVVGRLYDPWLRDKMDFEFEASLRLACPTEIPLTNLTFVPKNHNYFFNAFSSAFVKLSSTNVLTDVQCDVRRQCNQIN
ncbi:Peroxidase 29, partial [Mucuna pruriens]